MLGTQRALRSVDGDTMDTGQSHRVILPLKLGIKAYRYLRAVCSSHDAHLSYAHPFLKRLFSPVRSFWEAVGL
jgi:hypothetical protein